SATSHVRSSQPLERWLVFVRVAAKGARQFAGGGWTAAAERGGDDAERAAPAPGGCAGAAILREAPRPMIRTRRSDSAPVILREITGAGQPRQTATSERVQSPNLPGDQTMRPRSRFVLFFPLALSLLSACSKKEEAIVPDPEGTVITLDQAGGGEKSILRLKP